MAVGFVLGEHMTTAEAAGYGAAAEAAGFDGLLMADRYQPWVDVQGQLPRAWAALGVLGQRTRRIPFGVSVASPLYRYRPTVLAHAFAALVARYPGRVFLGLGPGDDGAEAAGDWGAVRERAERLAEAVTILRRLWRGERVTHLGPHFHLREARLYDTPAQAAPLYVVAEGPASMALAGRYGDGVITGAGAALRPELRAAFAAGARAAGRDPADLPILAELFVVVGDGAPPPAADAASPGAWVVSADPEEHAAAIRALLDAGVGEVYVNAAQPDQRRAIDFYSREVLPRVRGELAQAL